jgi:hypothetical protein
MSKLGEEHSDPPIFSILSITFKILAVLGVSLEEVILDTAPNTNSYSSEIYF